MTEALGELGAVPAGNAPGNREWLTRKRKTPAGWDKPELVIGGDGGGSLEERLTTLLATHDVVAFIKGTRKSPECTFSQSLVTMLHVRLSWKWLSDSALFAPLSACGVPSTTRRLQAVGSLLRPQSCLANASGWLGSECRSGLSHCGSRLQQTESESIPRDARSRCEGDV
jgi:hypothetical protein